MTDLPLVILCGGLGTRLRPAVSDIPKVLADINGRPFLAHLLDRVQDQGIREIYLSTGYLSEHLESFARDRSGAGLTVRCIREEEPLGTGGALRFVWETGGVAAPFFVMNGDTFFSGDLNRMVETHRVGAGIATLAVVEVARADRYGIVRFASDGSITAFEEKGSTSGPAWINAGAYLVEEPLLESVPRGRSVSLEREVFPEWIGRGLLACPFPTARFLDIGTPEDYHRAQHILR